jgi:hypothetical protein
MKTTAIDDDWQIVLRFLPSHWATKATELKALVRRRKISTAEILLRVLLIHLADGKSLRTTVAYAEQIGLCRIEDVALLHRLKASTEWFRWMCLELLKQLQVKRRGAIPQKSFEYDSSMAHQSVNMGARDRTGESIIVFSWKH